MSKILSKIGKKKKELLERKIGGKKSKIGSALDRECYRTKSDQTLQYERGGRVSARPFQVKTSTEP